MKDQEILIFRTSIATMDHIGQIEILFAQYPYIQKWSVDFEDWEKVLRIESIEITADEIIKLLQTIDIIASELE